MLDEPFPGGYTFARRGRSGRRPLHYRIVKDDDARRSRRTAPLRRMPLVLTIDWDYAINDAKKIHGRTGAEFFKNDGNCIYEIAQWFPRMAAYNDATGWQHKQFLGRGEFTLEFGDYLVAHHRARRPRRRGHRECCRTPTRCSPSPSGERLLEAREAPRSRSSSSRPKRPRRTRKAEPTGKKTWIFQAENVRDFAFASSRKFIWDAQGARRRRQPGDGHVVLSRTKASRSGASTRRRRSSTR